MSKSNFCFFFFYSEFFFYLFSLYGYRCLINKNFDKVGNFVFAILQSNNIDTGKCDGSAIKLNHQEIKIALKQANEQLGGEGRLPSRQELEGLICAKCTPPKINLKYFPGTESEPYWTGQRNWISPRNYWSEVNHGLLLDIGQRLIMDFS